MISSLKINLNQIIVEIFRGIRMCLWCWKNLHEQDLIKFIWQELDIVGDIDLKVIFAAENSNKFQKTKFLKKNQLRTS